MHIVRQLGAIPGVIAAGEYAYHGDELSFEGALTAEFVRIVSIMCRVNTLMAHMQSGILDSFTGPSGLRPVQGWIVRGARMSFCAVGSYFAMVDNREGTLDAVVRTLRAGVGDLRGEVLPGLYARIGGDVNEALY
jgi:roadblock/LC7 domain-containing protein